MATAEDDHGLSVPIFLGGEKIDGANDSEEHADEIVGFAAGDSSETVIFEGGCGQAVGLSVVMFWGAAVRDTVGIDVHRKKPFFGPSDGAGGGGASNSGAVEGKDGGFEDGVFRGWAREIA